jgi:hypothetical protein
VKRARAGRIATRARGSIMPFIAFSSIFFVGTLGISIDMLRDMQTAQQLEYAAQQAGLYGESFAVDQNGNFTNWTAAASSITNAIVSQSARFGWQAQCGPIGKIWSEPVTFQTGNIALRQNPQDATESFIDVTGVRTGNSSLKQLFWPIYLTGLPGTNQPQNQITVSSQQLAEVFSQPATRVGPGSPNNGQNQRATELAGFAVLPLAISNQEYAAMVTTSKVGAPVVIDLVSPPPAVAAGHVRGCLVNDSATGSTGGAYYGSAQGNVAISQLESLLQYFSNNTQTNLAPAAVEIGSQLNAFNPADPKFVARENEILTALNKLTPGKNYILPVIAKDPTFAGANVVVGFARLQLTGFTAVGTQITGATGKMADSVPLRNCSSVAGMATIPPNLGSQLPQPVAPFLPRIYRASDNSLAPRTPGLVYAPALSPYKNPPLAQVNF